MNTVKTNTAPETTAETAAPRSNVIRAKAPPRDCNLCNTKFSPHNRFERFCARCKEESPIYHYADWMMAS